MTNQKVSREKMQEALRILETLANRAPRCFDNREAIGLSDNKPGPILKREIKAIRAVIEKGQPRVSGEFVAQHLRKLTLRYDATPTPQDYIEMLREAGVEIDPPAPPAKGE